MKIAIIKYNAGNIMSVSFALQRLGIAPIITNDIDELQKADKVIFPGVGEASTTMKYLKAHNLDLLIKNLKQPVLGICLGMQLMCKHSEEGDTTCLGIFEQNVKKFEPLLKVPHMGWNTIYNLNSPLFIHIPENKYVYFVHSYYAETGTDTIANASYILPFSAAIRKNNFYATQFHPEKSGDIGAQILENFINL